MTKTISTLTLVSVLTFGGAVAHASEAAPRRGGVVVDGPAVKAMVVGPIDIHAYSGFTGGALYTAPALTGTDADCQGRLSDRATTNLDADVVVSFRVPAGQVACLVTSRNLEVLWHTQKGASSAPTTMMAHR